MNDIPGFYYDPVVKKYFKIQANGSAPTTSKYSSEDVKRRKIEGEMERVKEEKAAKVVGRLQRSTTLNSALAGGLLKRKLDQNIRLDMSQILAADLVPCARIRSAGGTFTYLQGAHPSFVVEPRPNLGPSICDISVIVEDRLAIRRIDGDIYIKSVGRQAHEGYFIPPAYPYKVYFNFERRFLGSASSICLNHVQRKAAFTWNAEALQGGVIIVDMDMPGGHSHGYGVFRPSIIDTSDGIEDIDVFSSLSGQPGSSLSFIFGTSCGVLTFDETYGKRWLMAKQSEQSSGLSRKIAVLAVENLPRNPTVILAGTRSGSLHLLDLREKQSSLTTTLYHPSAITNIHAIDEHRLVAAGLHSTLCQYDLRFPQSTTGTRAKINSQRTEGPTRPVLEYPGHINEATIGLGVDVDLEGGIIAAAQEFNYGDPSVVKLFSLHGGNELKSKINHKLREVEVKNVRCCKWVEDYPGRAKSLYVSIPNSIYKFGRYGPENEEG